MKVRVLKLIIAAVALLLTMSCILLLLNCADAVTGYVNNAGKALYAVAAVLAVSPVVLWVYLSRRSDARNKIKQCELSGKAVFGVLKVAVAGTFAVRAVFAYRAYVLAAADKAFLITVAAAAAASAVAMVVSALSDFVGIDNERIGYLSIAPILYYAVHTLYIFKNYPSLLSAPLEMLHVISLLAILLFTLHASRAILGVESRRGAMTFTLFAWLAVFVFNFANLFCESHGGYHLPLDAGTYLDVAMLFYITMFSYKICK